MNATWLLTNKTLIQIRFYELLYENEGLPNVFMWLAANYYIIKKNRSVKISLSLTK